MLHLCILIQEPLSLFSFDNELREYICVGDTIYNRCYVDTDTLIFYDWLLNDLGIVRGIELHLSPYDSLLQSTVSLTRIASVELNCFVRIWFSQNRDAVPSGMEAFGDLLFYRSQSGNLLITVGIDNWLTLSQTHQIISDFGKQGGINTQGKGQGNGDSKETGTA